LNSLGIRATSIDGTTDRPIRQPIDAGRSADPPIRPNCVTMNCALFLRRVDRGESILSIN